MDCLTHALLVRDAYCITAARTEEGREYLDRCWTLKQTAPNREALRKQFS